HIQRWPAYRDGRGSNSSIARRAAIKNAHSSRRDGMFSSMWLLRLFPPGDSYRWLGTPSLVWPAGSEAPSMMTCVVVLGVRFGPVAVMVGRNRTSILDAPLRQSCWSALGPIAAFSRPQW